MAIELLKPEVIDQIAAGEVVERPAHLIKELVENSLDAGSTQIEVHFSLGGRSVRIVDNGSGMSRMDLPKSLDRFATSKIATTDDIWRLKSFGFRGEALASIASVSEMQLISREQNTEQAYRLISRFGVREELDPISGSPGTSILIEKLFENVPDFTPYLQQARVFLHPHLGGSGIQNKVLEAMSAGAPVVTTPSGNQGIYGIHREHLMIGKNDNELAQFAIEILENEELAKKISTNGRQHILNTHSWEIIYKNMDDIISELFNEK